MHTFKERKRQFEPFRMQNVPVVGYARAFLENTEHGATRESRTRLSTRVLECHAPLEKSVSQRVEKLICLVFGEVWRNWLPDDDDSSLNLFLLARALTSIFSLSSGQI
jgi:hypothetical protein